jgi:hypothetical protein
MPQEVDEAVAGFDDFGDEPHPAQGAASRKLFQPRTTVSNFHSQNFERIRLQADTGQRLPAPIPKNQHLS